MSKKAFFATRYFVRFYLTKMYFCFLGSRLKAGQRHGAGLKTKKRMCFSSIVKMIKSEEGNKLVMLCFES